MPMPKLPMPESLKNRRYVLQKPIGEPWGMGEVYLAEDSDMPTSRQVVVKLVRIDKDQVNENKDKLAALENFEREAGILTNAHHPHVVAIYDYGKEEQGNYILAYMVMPHCEGGSLQDWLMKYRANESLGVTEAAKLLEVTEVAEILKEVGFALAHLHKRWGNQPNDKPIIHRDIKPSNFLVEHRSPDASALPLLLLTDFGLAQVAGGDKGQNSLGTYQYKAPEQWNKWEPIQATDQYQLAIMTYYLLTHIHPFDCDRTLSQDQQKSELERQHLYVKPSAPSTHISDIPREVDDVILKALSKYPGQRYSSILEFVNEFRKACGLEPVLIRDSRIINHPEQLIGNTSHPTEALVQVGQDNSLTSTRKPLKKRAILDRRFATDIVVLFSRSSESVHIDPRIPGLFLFSSGLYEQLLVENIYGSVLASILDRERDVLGQSIQLFETLDGQEDEEFILAVRDAGDVWRKDDQFQLIVSEYDGLKGSHLGNSNTNIAYLETTLRLAKQLDAAIIPHPDRWYLYNWWFEHNIWATGNEFSNDTNVPLPETLSDPVLAIPKIKMERLTRLSAKLVIPLQQNITLAHYGPIPYPFPEGLLRHYDREDLASFSPFLYEFCIPAPSM